MFCTCFSIVNKCEDSFWDGSCKHVIGSFHFSTAIHVTLYGRKYFLISSLNVKRYELFSSMFHMSILWCCNWKSFSISDLQMRQRFKRIDLGKRLDR